MRATLASCARRAAKGRIRSTRTAGPRSAAARRPAPRRRAAARRAIRRRTGPRVGHRPGRGRHRMAGVVAC